MFVLKDLAVFVRLRFSMFGAVESSTTRNREVWFAYHAMRTMCSFDWCPTKFVGLLIDQNFWLISFLFLAGLVFVVVLATVTILISSSETSSVLWGHFVAENRSIMKIKNPHLNEKIIPIENNKLGDRPQPIRNRLTLPNMLSSQNEDWLRWIITIYQNSSFHSSQSMFFVSQSKKHMYALKLWLLRHPSPQ